MKIANVRTAYEVPADQEAALYAAITATIVAHGGVARERIVRELSDEFRLAGLDDELNYRFVGDGIETFDELCALDPEGITELNGLRWDAVKAATLMLAALPKPRALSGCELVPLDDLVELLELKIKPYAALKRAKYARLSELTTGDLVDLERRMDAHEVAEVLAALRKHGLDVSPLKPDRVLADLTFHGGAKRTLIECGYGLRLLVADLRIDELRSFLGSATVGSAPLDPALASFAIVALQQTLRRYGKELA